MKFSDFGFEENPFAITPDPRYLYLSRGHEESLAHLIYGTGPNGGFVLLTGEVGTGKTLLLRSLLAQQLDNVDIALILNPRLSRREFIATICDELGIEYEGPPYSLKILIDILTRHLLRTHAEGKHTVLVVDEAQNLSPRVLEQVRLLTNLETSRHKLLRIILVGQPELQQMLERKEMRQVDQRITARYHLLPLNAQETGRYIAHRLAVAGVREDLFTPMALRLIHRFSGGIPRVINAICERALLAIYASGRQRAGVRLVWRAAREVKGKRLGNQRWVWGGALLIILLGAMGYWYSQTGLDQAVVPHEEATLPEPAIPELPTVVEESQSVEMPILPDRKTDRDENVSISPQKEIAERNLSSSPQALPSTDTSESPADDFRLGKLFSQPQRRVDMYQTLLGLWHDAKQFQDSLPPCQQVRAFGLRCLISISEWSGLLGMNRPLLLQLKQDKQRRLLLLKHVDDEWLLVDSGMQEGVISRTELMRYWTGEYILLWRPLAEIALIGEGSSGNAVTWLRNRLQRVDGIEPPAIEGLDRFDAELEDRLKAFQRQQGLTADGVAGQQTMIYLNNLAIPAGTPVLISTQDLAGG
ncbi:MAG: AAA family ATPase [Candidatus Thiodiazotropha endolucinida]